MSRPRRAVKKQEPDKNRAPYRVRRPVLISQQTYLKKRNNLNNLRDQENAISRELTLTGSLVKLSQHSEAVAFVFKEGQDLVEGFGIGF